MKLNDILLRVGEFAIKDESVIESADQLEKIAAELEVGTVLVLTIMRDGAEQQRLITVSDELTNLGPLALNDVLLRVGEFAIEGETAIESAGQFDRLIGEQEVGTKLVLTIWLDGVKSSSDG